MEQTNDLRADSFLGLFNDPFFSYDKKTDTVTVYNTQRSDIPKGSFTLADFIDMLRHRLPEADMDTLESFESHLAIGTEYFSLSFSCNFVNDDSSAEGTLLRGRRTGENNDIVVGVLHPKRPRNYYFASNARFDSLTGLVDKVCITDYAIDLIDSKKQKGTIIAIIDIDYFKHVNDSYGHQYGDYVLKRTADIIRSEVGERGLIGRIGGDEFFVVFNSYLDEAALRDCLRNIRTDMNKTFEGKGPTGEGNITVSIGAASFPADAESYNDLFVLADYCLYLAKSKGRNRYIIYNHDKHPAFDAIKKSRESGKKIINGRDDLPHGDVLTQILYMLRYVEDTPLPGLLGDFAFRFNIPYLALVDTKSGEELVRAGRMADVHTPDMTALTPHLNKFANIAKPNRFGIYVCNHVAHFPPEYDEALDAIKSMELISFILSPIERGGRTYYLFFGSFESNLVWNEEHFTHFRLLSDELASAKAFEKLV